MSAASTLRLAHALPLAFGLAFVWPEAADAGFDVAYPVSAVAKDVSAPAPRRTGLAPTDAGAAPSRPDAR
jgi:hypothetical protein